MMKSEFEKMIGKEITAETYAIYEAMYTATPETIDKETFVGMLNITAIPEAPEAIERRRKADEWKQTQLKKVEELKKELCEAKKSKADAESDYYYWKPLDTEYSKNSCFKRIKLYNQRIKAIKSQIAELKFCLTLTA